MPSPCNYAHLTGQIRVLLAAAGGALRLGLVGGVAYAGGINATARTRADALALVGGASATGAVTAALLAPGFGALGVGVAAADRFKPLYLELRPDGSGLSRRGLRAGDLCRLNRAVGRALDACGCPAAACGGPVVCTTNNGTGGGSVPVDNNGVWIAQVGRGCQAWLSTLFPACVYGSTMSHRCGRLGRQLVRTRVHIFDGISLLMAFPECCGEYNHFQCVISMHAKTHRCKPRRSHPRWRVRATQQARQRAMRSQRQGLPAGGPGRGWQSRRWLPRGCCRGVGDELCRVGSCQVLRAAREAEACG